MYPLNRGGDGMRESHGGSTAALLGRTALLAGILAVIAGILGMHVMTGNHAAHSHQSLATASAPAVAAPDHAEHHHAVVPPATHDHAAAQCSCSGSCSGMQAMGAPCTPSAKTASFTAPPPGDAGLAVNDSAGFNPAAPAAYSYLPGSPSPGDLSISRT
jgi:hypothetical protein